MQARLPLFLLTSDPAAPLCPGWRREAARGVGVSPEPSPRGLSPVARLSYLHAVLSHGGRCTPGRARVRAPQGWVAPARLRLPRSPLSVSFLREAGDPAGTPPRPSGCASARAPRGAPGGAPRPRRAPPRVLRSSAAGPGMQRAASAVGHMSPRCAGSASSRPPWGRGRTARGRGSWCSHDAPPTRNPKLLRTPAALMLSSEALTSAASLSLGSPQASVSSSVQWACKPGMVTHTCHPSI